MQDGLFHCSSSCHNLHRIGTRQRHSCPISIILGSWQHHMSSVFRSNATCRISYSSRWRWTASIPFDDNPNTHNVLFENRDALIWYPTSTNTCNTWQASSLMFILLNNSTYEHLLTAETLFCQPRQSMPALRFRPNLQFVTSKIEQAQPSHCSIVVAQ